MSVRVKVKNIAQVRVSTDHLDPAGGAACAVKFSGALDLHGANHAVVAAVSGKKIRVLKVFLQGSGAANLTFESATVAITGLIACSATAGVPFKDSCEFGLFETKKGEALTATVSANNLRGYLTYVEV